MLLSDPTLLRRRAVLLGAAAAATSLTACGFTPAYGPNGGAGVLQNNVLVRAPEAPLDYFLTRRLEERLGRPSAPTFALDYSLRTRTVGTADSGGSTRQQITGVATWALKQIGTTIVLAEGRSENFTGYSNTGATVSETAARDDARERLMTILADQIVDDLILSASDLPR